MAKLDYIYQKLGPGTGEFDPKKNQINLLQSRLYELEDTARRDNLLFHGIVENKESWDESEKKFLSLLELQFHGDVTGQDIARLISWARSHRRGASQ